MPPVRSGVADVVHNLPDGLRVWTFVLWLAREDGTVRVENLRQFLRSLEAVEAVEHLDADLTGRLVRVTGRLEVELVSHGELDAHRVVEVGRLRQC